MTEETQVNQAVVSYVKTCLSLSGKVAAYTENTYYGSKYTTLENVLDTILPACHDNGLVPLQEIIKADVGISVRTTLVHVEGSVLVLEPMPIPVEKNSAHGVVSASTYGRRVSLMAIFGLAPSDDDGNAATDNQPTQVCPEPVDQEKVNEAYEVFRSVMDTGLEVDEMDYQLVQDVYKDLSNDEKMAVWNLLGSDKPEGMRRGYRSIIKELNAKEVTSDE